MMTTTRSAILPAALAALALTLVGCSAPSAPTSDPETGTGAAETAEGGGSSGASGASVTIDGTTWEYPSYLCVTGYENTESDVYSFSSTAFTTTDGEKIQLLIDVFDDSGQDRLSGDGVIYEITVFDYASDTPSVDVAVAGESGVEIADGVITVSGDFTPTDGSGTVVAVEAQATCS